MKYRILRFFYLNYWKLKLRPVKFAYQRVVRGYDDSALWDYLSFFKDTIVPILEYYKNDAHGFPTSPFNDTSNKTDEERYKEDEEEWNKVLDQMIIGFKKIDDEDNFDWEESKEYKQAMKLFSVYLPALWD